MSQTASTFPLRIPMKRSKRLTVASCWDGIKVTWSPTSRVAPSSTRKTTWSGSIGQVVGEPAVAGPEGLGLRGLGVPHDAQDVRVGLEAHDLVEPDPELLPRPGEVQVLGREAQQAGVGVYRLLPFYGPAPELARAVIGELSSPLDPRTKALEIVTRQDNVAYSKSTGKRMLSLTGKAGSN